MKDELLFNELILTLPNKESIVKTGWEFTFIPVALAIDTLLLFTTNSDGKNISNHPPELNLSFKVTVKTYNV